MYTIFLPSIIRILKQTLLLIIILILYLTNLAGQPSSIKWSDDGNSYYTLNNNQIVKYTLPGNQQSVLVSAEKLSPG